MYSWPQALQPAPTDLAPPPQRPPLTCPRSASASRTPYTRSSVLRPIAPTGILKGMGIWTSLCCGCGIECPLDGHLRRAEGGLQDQFLPSALRGVREGPEHLQPLRDMRCHFQMCRALQGALARPLPVANRLLAEARLRVMMGHQ